MENKETEHREKITGIKTIVETILSKTQKLYFSTYLDGIVWTAQHHSNHNTRIRLTLSDLFIHALSNVIYIDTTLMKSDKTTPKPLKTEPDSFHPLFCQLLLPFLCNKFS